MRRSRNSPMRRLQSVYKTRPSGRSWRMRGCGWQSRRKAARGTWSMCICCGRRLRGCGTSWRCRSAGSLRRSSQARWIACWLIFTGCSELVQRYNETRAEDNRVRHVPRLLARLVAGSTSASPAQPRQQLLPAAAALRCSVQHQHPAAAKAVALSSLDAGFMGIHEHAPGGWRRPCLPHRWLRLRSPSNEQTPNPTPCPLLVGVGPCDWHGFGSPVGTRT
mmetsp:Transcript_16931/g.55166  ORF Transcript_16931/g.55166 Transcript_16931/m.55166 type:complete len:220 (+) Transcript_16931:384-1043(+)